MQVNGSSAMRRIESKVYNLWFRLLFLNLNLCLLDPANMQNKLWMNNNCRQSHAVLCDDTIKGFRCSLIESRCAWRRLKCSSIVYVFWYLGAKWIIAPEYLYKQSLVKRNSFKFNIKKRLIWAQTVQIKRFLYIEPPQIVWGVSRG